MVDSWRTSQSLYITAIIVLHGMRCKAINYLITISQVLSPKWTSRQTSLLTIIYVFVLCFLVSHLNMYAMLTVTVLRMCSILCFHQLGNSRIMVLKLRSSWITVIFLKSQKHTRHIFAKVVRIALILTLHPSWWSVCSSFPISIWYSTPSPSHFRYPYFLHCSSTADTYLQRLFTLHWSWLCIRHGDRY